jgi:uncharacterized membrane protein
MSIAQAISAPTRSGSRWLLLGSLALNLFFVGVAIAMAVRPAPAPSWDRDVFVRVERVAATLPQADADILRGAMQANHDAIANAQNKYQAGREAIHEALRQNPFKSEDLRAAMAQARAARQVYDQTIQGSFAGIADKLSPAARRQIADRRKPESASNDK